MKRVKLVIDAGVSIEDRLVLESSAIQIASAYKGMKISIYYAGKSALRGKYDIIDTNNFKKAVNHIEEVGRRNIQVRYSMLNFRVWLFLGSPEVTSDLNEVRAV